VPPEEIEQYNDDRQAYRNAYRAYLKAVNDRRDWLARIVEIEVWLTNGGGAPAAEVEASITLPGCFEQLGLSEADRGPRPMVTDDPPNDRIEAPRRPYPPPPPAPPQTDAAQYKQMHQDDLIRSLMITPRPRPTWAEVIEGEGRTFVVNVDVDRLRHGARVRVCTLVGVFASWTGAHPFRVAYTAAAANHPKPMTGDVLVRVAVAGAGAPDE
jgi:hypothetical protein